MKLEVGSEMGFAGEDSLKRLYELRIVRKMQTLKQLIVFIEL